MKIGIISDTHDQTGRVKKAVEIFNKEKVGLIIHCGDIVSPFTLQFYKESDCPIKFLFGNNTGDVRMHLTYAKNFGLHNYEFGTFFSLEVDGKKIAVYHGENMVNTITKTEYQVLRTEMKELKEKLGKIERIFKVKETQRKVAEDEILAIAKDAEKLANEEKLPELRDLRDLR